MLCGTMGRWGVWIPVVTALSALGACAKGEVDARRPGITCDGTLAPDGTCVPRSPVDCGATLHGGNETRLCYEAASVPESSTCSFTVQVRRCDDGAWSPDFPSCPFLSCVVEGHPSCGAVPHGASESRDCYPAPTVPAGASCVPVEQTRTCVDGAFSPLEFPSCPSLTCAVEGYANCGATPHGSVETRDCFPVSSVPHGSACVPVAQTRTCDHDDVWSPDWPPCDHLNCVVEPPPACSLLEPEGTCPPGEFCSAAGDCIPDGTCALDADCAQARVCHVGSCTTPSATYVGDGPDVLGVHTMCDIFAPDPSPSIVYGGDLAFQKCELALTLAKNMGVSWIRWGVPWYWMTSGQGPTAQVRLAFIERVLQAARARGLKILFQLAIAAPPYAYDPPNCDTAVPPNCAPSHLLTFQDSAFAAWVDELLELTRPYTQFYELFNEVNWGGEGLFIPLVTAAGDNPRLRLMTRLKQLYELTRARMDAAALAHPDWSPLLIASGFSYGETFYDTDGYDGTGQLTSVAGLNVVADLGVGTPSGGGRYLGSVIDVLSVHPYWVTPGLHAPRLAEMRTAVNSAAGGPGYPVWASEVGYVKCDPESAVCCPYGPPCYWSSTNEGVDYIDGLMQAVSAGSIQKLFWFATHAWIGLETTDSNQFGMYSEDGWTVRRFGQVEALRQYARAASYDVRFTPPSSSAPLLRDLNAAPGRTWESITGVTTTPQTYGGARVGAFSGTTEAGSSATGVRMTLDNSVDYVVGNFTSIAVPATGIPTLRLSFGYAASAPTGAQVTFELWLIGGSWPSNQISFPFPKGKTGALETIELDLSQVRGSTINVVMRAHRTGALGASTDVVWATPVIIDRDG